VQPRFSVLHDALAHGAISTWLHAAGRFASLSDGFGFAGSTGGAGCNTPSENQ